MEHWHWPQYGMAIWYAVVIFGTVAGAIKARSDADQYQAIGNVAIALLIVVVLHCGGFW